MSRLKLFDPLQDFKREVILSNSESLFKKTNKTSLTLDWDQDYSLLRVPTRTALSTPLDYSSCGYYRVGV